jgi:hypothetical protein
MQSQERLLIGHQSESRQRNLEGNLILQRHRSGPCTQGAFRRTCYADIGITGVTPSGWLCRAGA